MMKNIFKLSQNILRYLSYRLSYNVASMTTPTSAALGSFFGRFWLFWGFNFFPSSRQRDLLIAFKNKQAAAEGNDGDDDNVKSDADILAEKSAAAGPIGSGEPDQFSRAVNSRGADAESRTPSEEPWNDKMDEPILSENNNYYTDDESFFELILATFKAYFDALNILCQMMAFCLIIQFVIPEYLRWRQNNPDAFSKKMASLLLPYKRFVWRVVSLIKSIGRFFDTGTLLFIIMSIRRVPPVKDNPVDPSDIANAAIICLAVWTLGYIYDFVCENFFREKDPEEEEDSLEAGDEGATPSDVDTSTDGDEENASPSDVIDPALLGDEDAASDDVDPAPFGEEEAAPGDADPAGPDAEKLDGDSATNTVGSQNTGEAPVFGSKGGDSTSCDLYEVFNAFTGTNYYYKYFCFVLLLAVFGFFFKNHFKFFFRSTQIFFLSEIFSLMSLKHTIWDKHVLFYPSPKYLNYNWGFGSLLGLIVGLQVATGLLLSCYYRPSEYTAFGDIIFMINDVNAGYLFKYLHLNGASAVFALLYLHLFRAIYYRSYAVLPKVWLTGMVLLVLMILTAFLGYVLPWGQMSFWAATVITNLITSIPVVGQKIIVFVHGAFSVQGATLSRFFIFHYLAALIVLVIILIHIILLHRDGSFSPSARALSGEKVHFMYFFYYKDMFFFFGVLLVLFYCALIAPNALNHPDNFVEANALVTPTHIVPEWYFLPFYAILRAIPNKLFGVVAMVAAIVCLFALPLMRKVSFLSYNVAEAALETYFYGFLFCYAVLGYLGSMPAEAPYVFAAQVFTVFYFLLFFVPFMANRAMKILITINSGHRFKARGYYATLPLILAVNKGSNNNNNLFGWSPQTQEELGLALFFSTAAFIFFVVSPVYGLCLAGWSLPWGAFLVGLGKSYFIYLPFQIMYLSQVKIKYQSAAVAHGKMRLAQLKANEAAKLAAKKPNAPTKINNSDVLDDSFFCFDYSWFSVAFAAFIIILLLVVIFAVYKIWNRSNSSYTHHSAILPVILAVKNDKIAQAIAPSEDGGLTLVYFVKVALLFTAFAVAGTAIAAPGFVGTTTVPSFGGILQIFGAWAFPAVAVAAVVDSQVAKGDSWAAANARLEAKFKAEEAADAAKLAEKNLSAPTKINNCDAVDESFFYIDHSWFLVALVAFSVILFGLLIFAFFKAIILPRIKFFYELGRTDYVVAKLLGRSAISTKMVLLLSFFLDCAKTAIILKLKNIKL